MNDDPYRVLGVSRTADEAAIRAAYLSLMKRHHPDRNDRGDDRAKEIAAAYQLLSSPERRAAHDRKASERRDILMAAWAEEAARAPRQTGRNTFFVLSAVTAGLLYVALTRPPPVFPSEPQPSAAVEKEAVPDILPPSPVVEEVALAEPLPVPNPMAVPVASELEGEAAAPEVVLPELPRPERPQARAAAASERRVEAVGPTEARASSSAPPVKAKAAAQPSIDLKALERHQIILYNQSFLAGDEARRERLLQTRLAFLKRLDQCGSDLCRRDAYLSRNQEVAAIMAR
jgi:hypothetical protein